MGMEMNRIIKRIELDFEKTIKYFVDHIECGKTLSKSIISRINFHEGHFFTLLPLNAKMDSVYEFNCGGIIPPIDCVSEGAAGNLLNFQKIETLDHECSEFVLSYLNNYLGGFVIIENYMAEPDSPHVNIQNVSKMIYVDEVYYLLDKKNSAKEIYEAIRKSSQVWHSLIVLSQLKSILSYLNNENINKICDNTKFVVAGAYDGEGFIFWEER